MGTNIVAINRGDTFEFNLTINDDSNVATEGLYHLVGDDAVYFGLMDPHQPFENALVKKKFTAENMDSEGNLIITIAAEDTLDLLPGRYYYMIKLHMDHDEQYEDVDHTIKVEHIDKVQTIINKTIFVIYD